MGNMTILISADLPRATEGFAKSAITNHCKLSSLITNVLSQVLEATHLRTWYCQDWFLLRVVKEKSVLGLSPSFWLFAGNLCFLVVEKDHSDFCLHFHIAFSLCVLLTQFPLFIRTPVITDEEPIVL